MSCWATGSAARGQADAAATRSDRPCGRLPLALTIAAARAATQPGCRCPLWPPSCATRAGRLDALDVGNAAANLRAVFSWAHQPLALPPPGCSAC